jgi:hypothetical protein
VVITVKKGGDGLLSGPLLRWQASKGTRRETINGPLGTIRLTRCGTFIYDCDANTVGEGERPPEGVHQTMWVYPSQGMSGSSGNDR